MSLRCRFKRFNLKRPGLIILLLLLRSRDRNIGWPRAFLRQRHKFVEVQFVPVVVIECRKACDLIKRVVLMDIFDRPRIEVVPRGVPTRLVQRHLFGEIHRSEVITETRHAGDESETTATHGDNQPIPVRMSVDIVRQVSGRGHEGVFRIEHKPTRLPRTFADGKNADRDRDHTGPLLCLQQSRSSIDTAMNRKKAMTT